jgi:carboxyl-terminal processing protease
MRSFGSKERIVWTIVTVVLLAGLAFFALSPRLLAGSAEDETQAYLATIGQIFRQIRDNYVDADKSAPKVLYEGALTGMFNSLGDQNSRYMAAKDWESLTDTVSGSFGGVGLAITKMEKVGAQVSTAFEGTPAFRAGITAGDVIVKVNGESMAELSLTDITSRLRGEPKTSVTVTVKRGEHIQFDAIIIRDIIEVPVVVHAMIGGAIGYMRISQFTPQAPERARDAIRSFQSAGYTSLILDLRQNPGGLLDAGVEVANLFIDQGLIVQRKNERVASENIVYNARRNRMMVDPKIPVVVLVDSGSASASEIVAGALRDYHRASLFGEKTYGKGSVQTVQALGDGGFRLTTSRYYLPSGATIPDKVGLDPDRLIKEPDLTDAEQKSLNELLNGTLINDFVKATPQPNDAQVTQFVASLHARGIVLTDRYLRRLVRDKVEALVNTPPPYDLDFDTVLQAAVKALQNHETGASSP